MRQAAGAPLPRTPNDLLQHQCIRYRFESGSLYRWDLEKDGRTINLDVQGPLTVTTMEHSLDAALAGLGIAFLPEPLALDHIADGRLVPLLEEWCPPFEGYCLYYPANRHPPTALRLFAEALREWTIGGFYRPEALSLGADGSGDEAAMPSTRAV